MFLLLGALIAGVLTVLAPCVLPLLSVVVGGSITATTKPNRMRPVIITASLAVSLTLFTLLLKATTLLVAVPPALYVYVSGGIIIALGIAILFPILYERLLVALHLQLGNSGLLRTGMHKQGYLGPILIGAALGPVFTSCSPVYAYILATVLPVHFAEALVYMFAYILGLSITLLLIGLIGQRFVRNIRWMSNPRGWFQRGVAVLFILVGVLIVTGGNVRLQTWVSAHTPLNLDAITAKLLPNTGTPVTTNADLNIQPYAAPTLSGLTNWINSPPLTLQQLKGKVVLVDFWTYSCINCIRSIPYLEDWYQTYQANGFVIIGVHAPEFSFEHVPENVAAAVKGDHITYPVALDNNYKTWNAFHNQYWPADYLIDKQGNVRRYYAGEGQYTQMESAIRDLLKEQGGSVTKSHAALQNNTVPVTSGQTPETYLGYDKATSFLGNQPLALGSYTFTPTTVYPDTWTLGGVWNVSNQTITAVSNATLDINVSARDVYLVGGTSSIKKVGVRLNGMPISQTNAAGGDVQNSLLTVSMPQLYKIVHAPAFTHNMTIELSVPAGVSLDSFTFGS